MAKPKSEPVSLPSTTTDKDVLDTLLSCEHRMQAQHNQIQFLSPKAQAWDVMCTVVTAMAPSQPYGADDLPSRMNDAVAMLRGRLGLK